MIDTVIFCSFICCGTHCSSCFHMPNFLVHCLLQMFSRNRRELERAECISAEKGRLNDCVPWSHLPRTMFRWLFSSLYTNFGQKERLEDVNKTIFVSLANKPGRACIHLGFIHLESPTKRSVASWHCRSRVIRLCCHTLPLQNAGIPITIY